MTDDTPISLAPPQEAGPEPIQLPANTVQPSYLLTPEIAQSKTFKTAYALAGTKADMPYPQIESNIQTGNEQSLREQTANIFNTELNDKRYSLMTQTLASRDVPLTPEDYKALDIAAGYNFPYAYPVNPNSVFEQAFGNQYVSELDRFATKLDDTHPWNVANIETPVEMDAVRKYGSVTIAQSQYLMTKAQDLQAKIQNQSWAGWGADLVKMAFPIFNPYYEIKMRGNVPGTSFFDSFMLGTNVEQQRQKLFSMPYNKFTEAVDEIATKLGGDNPQLALIFISSMLSYSTSDKLLDNINSVGHVADVAALTQGARAVIRSRGVAFNAASVENQVKAMTKDATQASMSPEDTKANVSAAIGDLGQSAVEKATVNVNSDLKGISDSVQRAIDDLPSYQKTLVKEIQASDFSTTHKNILEEQTKNTFDRFMKTIEKLPTPNSLPIDSLTPEQLEMVSKTVPRRYGIENDLVNITTPEYNPFSRGYDVRMWLGKDAGVYFETEQEALKAAQWRGFKAAYSKDHIANLEARVEDLKATLKEAPEMDADTAGLNLRYAQEEQIVSLQKELQEAKKATEGYPIKNNGLGYYVEITGSLNHQDAQVSRLHIDPERPTSISPDSWTSNFPFFDHFRTSEDIFSVEQRANRKLAVYPQSTVMAIAKEDAKYMTDVYRGIKRFDDTTGEAVPSFKRYVPGISGLINKKYKKRFLDVLDYSQNTTNPLYPDSKEGWYMTPRELGDHYIRLYGEAPTFAEVQGYEAVKRWSEMDLMFRKIAEHRNMARMGVEFQEIVTKDISGAEVRSSKFDGTRMNKFPRSRQTILIMGDSTENSLIKSNESFSQKKLEQFDADVASGKAQMIKLYRPGHLPFKGFVKDGDTFISYVYAPRVEASPLGWDLIPRQQGGHMVYDYAQYIKQPNMKFEIVGGVRKANYLGDTTLIPVSYSPLGKDLIKKLNVVKNLIKDKNQTEAKKAYVNFGLEGAFGTWKEFRGNFVRVKDPEGNWVPPRFNLQEDFELVPRNKSIPEMSDKLARKYGESGAGFWKNSWRDATKEGSPADLFQVEFTGQRDAKGLYSVENVGSERNPVYRRSPAKKIDPLTILNRGMRRIIHSSFMDDYKDTAVNAWIQSAKEHINDHNSFIESAPYYYFKNANRNMFYPGTEQSTVNRLMAQHFQINQLVGSPTVLDSFVYDMYQKLADSTYKYISPKAANYVTPDWLLPKLRDPFGFMRSITHHSFLGMFNPAQIIVQMQSFTNMFAITPRHATTGTMGSFLHSLGAVNGNSEIINHLDSLATKMRIPGLPKYLPGEWKEARDLYFTSGFGMVGEEYATKGNIGRTNLMSMGGHRFLEMGESPFKAGEKMSRIGSWYIAMKEFRTTKPTGQITKGDIAKIFDRADLLYNNMSNASYSAFNSGVFSLPFQFFNYTSRMAELFWSGSRLGGTLKERNMARARLIFANSLLYGAPLGIGVTGLPMGDWIRRKAIEEGIPGFSDAYVPGRNGIETQLMEGAQATFLHMLTGKYYATGPRYGLQGMEFWKDLLWQDEPFWKIVGGASASLGSDWYSQQSGLFSAIGAMASGNYKDFPLQGEDLLNLFKPLYIVNKGEALWWAINTGRWIDKNYNTVEKVTKDQAALMFLSGLSTTEGRDVWHKGLNLKDRNSLQNKAIKEFQKEFSRSILAYEAGDEEQSDAYRKRAMSWLVGSDFPPERLGAAMAKVIKQVGTDKINSINFQYYLKNVTPAQRKAMGDAFEWINNNKGR